MPVKTIPFAFTTIDLCEADCRDLEKRLLSRTMTRDDEKVLDAILSEFIRWVNKPEQA